MMRVTELHQTQWRSPNAAKVTYAHQRETTGSSSDSSNASLFKMGTSLKDKDYCPIEIIKGLTDKGQFQYLTKLMGPQEGTYLYATQFHSLR